MKKISGYISKKVAEKLDKLFNTDRAEFEKKWDDIRIFIEYGMLTDEKFYESALKFFLLKDVSGKYYSLEDYKKLVEPNQTDKDSTLIYLYTTDPTAQYSYIKAAEDKGYDVLLMTGELDEHFMSMLESKNEKLRFVRVDSDIPERLIAKEDEKKNNLSGLQRDIITGIFSKSMPKVEGAEFIVSLESLGEDASPATVTQNEFMRRMKKMAEQQQGMGFMSNMPDNYMLVVNVDHPAVKRVLEDADADLASKVAPLFEKINSLNSELSTLRDSKAAENASEEKKEELRKEAEVKEKEVADLRSEQEKLIAGYADGQNLPNQIIDLALLRSNLLKGSELNDFINRSIALL